MLILICLDISSQNQNFIINDHYYSLVLCFLTFNLSALIGTYFSTLFTWVKFIFNLIIELN